MDTTITVQFGDWLPDDDRNVVPNLPVQYAKNAPVPLSDAKNVLFSGSAWRLYSPLTAAAGTVAAAPLDAITVNDNGALKTFCAANGKLYSIISGTVTDVSGGQTFNATAPWVFQQFGSCLIATNGIDAVQDFDLGTSTAFAALGGSPPKAVTVGVVRDFIVLGNVNDGSAHPYRVQWGAIANPTNWPTPLTQAARAAQSGYQDLYSQYGNVQFIAQGEEYGLVFQQRGIVRMQYIGGDVVFQFFTYEQKRGLVTPRAAAQIGNIVYFLSADGFYGTDGSSIDPIGYGKVNRWFLANCYDMSKVRASVDSKAQCIYWSFPNAAGPNNSVIVFNMAEEKWSYAVDTTYALFQSLDVNGDHIPAAFNASNVLSGFTGTETDGEIETKSFRLADGSHALVKAARPLVDSICQVAIASQVSDDDAQTFGSFVSRGTRTREIPLRSDGVIHAIRTLIGSGASYAQGVEIDFVPRGRG